MSLFQSIEVQLSDLVTRFEELEAALSDPGVSQDPTRFQTLLKERGKLDRVIAPYREIRALRGQIADTVSERDSTTDDEMRVLCDDMIEEMEASLERAEESVLDAFIQDPDDSVDQSIVEIRAGTGGDEASLWAADLFRMYCRFAERQGWKLEMLNESRSGMDGLKEVVFSATGTGAYLDLKYESGVHRVQRVPETEAKGRIHTSTATVAVLPEASDVDLEIKDVDLKIDTYCSSGPGGQKVNKTASAIRITHIPSGLVVTCQDEKSQHKNKAKALKVLKTRLYDLERQKVHDARSEARRSQIGTGERSEKIRTYNYPQSRVTDHRIKGGDEERKNHNLLTVLDGDLYPLIESLAKLDRELRLKDLADRLQGAKASDAGRSSS